MFEFAFESMAAQVNSKFGLALDKLWEKVIQYRDTELKDETSFLNKEKKLQKFFDKEILRSFLDTVYKYTGLCVDKVAYVNALHGISFCTWMFIGGKTSDDVSGTLQLENIINGGYLERYWGGLIKPLLRQGTLTTDVLVKLSTSYDAVHGCIKPEHREAMKKLVHCEIGFDIPLAFLMADMLPKNADVGNFTPREITAIMLHEIGHNLTLVEHAGDMWAQTSSFNYLTNSFTQQNAGNAKEALEFAKVTIKKAEESGQKVVANNLKKVAAKFSSDITAAGSSANIEAKRTMILGFIEGVMAIWYDLVLIPTHMIFGNNTFRRYAPLSSEQKKKFADFPVNERLCTWQERKADEYAFTHGYGADQVDALDRLGKIFKFYGKTEKEAEKLRLADELRRGISVFEKFRLLAFTPMWTGDYGFSLYPAGAKRFKELLNITIQQLKANSADPEYVAKYMSDIARILHKIEHSNQSDEFIARAQKGYELFLVYCSIPSFLDALIHGHVRREIETLVNDLQDVGNNLIFYYGNKIASLAKDK